MLELYVNVVRTSVGRSMYIGLRANEFLDKAKCSLVFVALDCDEFSRCSGIKSSFLEQYQM